MSSSSSTSRNQLQVTHVQSQEGVKLCDCVVPAKERTCWKITNPGRRFSMKLDAKEELSEMKNLRRRIAEVEFLLSQEQYKVVKSEKEVHDARKAIGRYRMIVALLFACLALCVLKLGVIVFS
ncbi:unnamed protein product [Lactuca virosa]|uniref:Uncharacterized protein n=1 Tax=Lactuca virosa TaxID=75947 RepID=A0AAU9PQF0_9ASTR|nr:unnamed protein product [Lactuca virosa]